MKMLAIMVGLGIVIVFCLITGCESKDADWLDAFDNYDGE